MDSERICPYPGLRPFTEGESLYFKGREKQVEHIISDLEKKKFLMITGASGDGKSSLVYAGLIPNARAGFFNAKFNNWIIADFRPERNPLKNLAKTIASGLNLPEEIEVEKELKFGYSSLVKLYKSTPHYVDYNSDFWKNADEIKKKKLKRKASNLLILVDQFEEFFTNKENFLNDVPSLNAAATVNVLLETARIALEEDLPIYVVCTMRSDYIGQCAVFRKLPENIGFSQFFVPRLRRKDLVQVIEEPAILSGNSISKRLSEVLINELNEGIDQLPVLQHALNQIWKLANAANENMDLIHFAMLGGISGSSLPVKDRERFEKWIINIPLYKKPFFDNPSLGNVLNAHAEELFETAADCYNLKFKPPISSEHAKWIIEPIFKCLTKIDDSKVARNRMSLKEIISLINYPGISIEMFGNLLGPFREQGNTFITPFITGDPASEKVSPDTVLDITHESLIRNWKRLKAWTREEHENLNTYNDLSNQVDRWLKSDKSKGYLLPIGPLAFFEKWHEKSNMSVYWLTKYDFRDIPVEAKEIDAAQTVDHVKEFIDSSRDAIIKKKNKGIFITLSVIILLSILTVWAFIERGKALEQQIIAQQQTITANFAKEKAILSERAALVAKDEAKTSEQMAIASKDTAFISKEAALRSQEEALKQKSIAESEFLKAKEQSIRAEKQTIIANDEAKKAEKERQIAESEKIKAEKAENRARQLTLISVAQNMALKSTLINENPQLKALLAMQAFLFTRDNAGRTQDPVLFEALRAANALFSDVKINVLRGLSDEPRMMLSPQATNTLISGGKDGVINFWDLASGKLKNNVKLKYSSPSCFISINNSGNNVLTGLDNKMVLLWNLAKPDNLTYKELIGHKGFLRAAAFNSRGNIVATGGKDSVIIVWNVASKFPIQIKKIPVKSNVKALAFHPNGTSIISAFENGNIILIDFETGMEKIIHNNNSPAYSLYLSSEKNMLAAGFNDGKIRLFDLNSPTFKFKLLNDNLAEISVLTINPAGTLLATASSDKSIKIYDLNHLDFRPVVLKDHKSKVRSLAFDNLNRLIAGCEDKTIRVWETSSEEFANNICGLLKRNMTQGEWKQYAGNQIPYIKTCNDLP